MFSKADENPSAPAKPVMRVRSVDKRFRTGKLALSNVNLDVQVGEFVSLVGPSGCGKSTLLRIAAGLSRATAGTIELNRSAIGYVFQDPTLLPWRTVAGNVELPTILDRIPKSERRRRVERAIDLVNLTGFENYYPRALSGGMAMRASLARALTLKPDLFFFDEPFGALDAITREHLNEELLRIYASENFTGVFVTHSISEAVYLSSRIVVMCAGPGRVVAEIAVPFEYPRSSQLRYDTKFNEISMQVSEALREVFQ